MYVAINKQHTSFKVVWTFCVGIFLVQMFLRGGERCFGQHVARGTGRAGLTYRELKHAYFEG